jgi:4-alpha-glucanotransferase
VWQVLPLGPVGHGGSPYGAASAFAGDESWFAPANHEGAPASGDGAEWAALDDFVEANKGWLHDWCLFAALKEKHGGRAWIEWDEPLRLREPSALKAAEQALRGEIARHRRAQFDFTKNWSAIRASAEELGISLLGDVPIYTAFDAADVWAHREMFWLDDAGLPTKVSGVPPDYFAKTGQLWGNPLYRWDRMEETGFAWWVARLKHQLSLHDVLRLDHFRGFAAYWAVPAGSKTAETGGWEPGPGAKLFEAARRALGGLPLVAEDLGTITEDVVELRTQFALPGMRVLQFGFDDPLSDHAPHRHTTDSVVYTGTHDNDTTRGWIANLDAWRKQRVLDYVGGAEESAVWSLIRTAYASVGDLSVVPMQDLLNLGSEARMNTPGIAAGNWGWRAPDDAFHPELAASLKRLAEITGRVLR